MAVDNVGGIEFRIDIDTAELIRADRLLRRHSSSQQRQFRNTQNSVNSLSASFGKLAGAIAAALSARVLIAHSDAWVRLNNQIKQTTDTATQALAVQEAIVKISASSKVELNGVAEAYQRISNSVAGYGFSSKETLDVVEGLTKAFKANGSTSQEVSSTLVQLGQALGAGALQGEELRAVLEASLPVSRAIAEEFEVTVGELKNLGAQGELTTERVFKALQNSLPEFQSAFSKASITVAEGMTVAGNSITRLVGLTDDATGAGETLSKGLITLSTVIDDLGDLVASGSASKIAEIFKGQLDSVRKDIEFTAKYIGDIWALSGEGMQASSQATASFIGDAFLNIIPNIQTMVKVITVEIASSLDKIKNYMAAAADSLNPFGEKSRGNIRSDLKKQNKRIDQVRKETIQGIFDVRAKEESAHNKKMKESRERLKAYKDEQEERIKLLAVDAKPRTIKVKPTKVEIEVSDSLDAYFDKESADSTKKDSTATANLTTQVQSVGLTPEQEIQARYDAEIELLRQAEEKKIEIEGTYADRRTQLEKERLESVRALQSDNNEFLEAAFGNLDTQIAGTMASVVTGAQSGEDALKSLATTIITQVVGAIIQQGIASVIASQTAAKGQTAANAEVLTTAVPLATATSLSSFGANAVPAIAGIAAVTAAMTGIAGAREFGGPVTAGKSYLVGERGPEMFTPGSSGGITSNKDMASGGQMNVIINNNAAGVDVSANQVDQRTVEISVRKSMQEFANQASTGQGVAINALTRNTNVTRKGGV